MVFTSCHDEDFSKPEDSTTLDCIFSDQQIPNLLSPNGVVPKISVKIKERSVSGVVLPTKPWENSGINYGNVLKVGDKWRMWYEAFDDTNGGDWDTNLCYAESKDGIDWEKPNLGLTKYGKDKKNNIVLSGAKIGGLHGINVFYDEAAPEEEKYKLTFIKPNEIDF